MGVGMPHALYLEQFGSMVWDAFGNPPYLVGSALQNKTFRDVDVRLILTDKEYDTWEFGDPNDQFSSGKWVSYCLAYSSLGTRITGLPIDFQIQQQSWANKAFGKNPRSAIGLIASRINHDEKRRR